MGHSAAGVSRIEAVIFDMDGLLIDSEPLWQTAEMEAFGALGLRLERSDCRQTMGMRVDEVVAYWSARYPWDESRWPRQRVAEVIGERVAGLIETEGEPRSGVMEGLEFVARQPVRMALASSSSLSIIETTLRVLRIRDRFELICSAESETHGKPHPGVYLTTARQLQTPPAACLALEDSLAGLRSAKAAGMRCAMVPDASLRGRAELEAADVLMASLADLAGGAWHILEAAPALG